jgi:two-component system, LytTR family, response regulator
LLPLLTTIHKKQKRLLWPSLNIYERLKLTMNKINALIVDDEKEACSNLQFLLEKHFKNEINILDSVNSTKEAEKAIHLLKPNTVFLDIEMPNENAFQFLERLEKIDFEIIFITAYDEYAIKAFKLNAVDYILKPINTDDLIHSITKLKERIIYNKILSFNADAYHSLAKEIILKEAPKQIILRNNTSFEIIQLSDIVYVKAMGGYSQIFFKKNNSIQKTLMSNPIAFYEETLLNNTFYRVHRSFLINCKYIKKIHKNENLEVELNDATMIPIGRRRYTDLIQFLKTI